MSSLRQRLALPLSIPFPIRPGNLLPRAHRVHPSLTSNKPPSTSEQDRSVPEPTSRSSTACTSADEAEYGPELGPVWDAPNPFDPRSKEPMEVIAYMEIERLRCKRPQSLSHPDGHHDRMNASTSVAQAYIDAAKAEEAARKTKRDEYRKRTAPSVSRP